MNLTRFRTRRQWLRARHAGIGASDAPCIMGCGFKSPYALWVEKTNAINLTAETEAMRMGHVMEPVIAKLLSKAIGRKLTDPGKYAIAQRDGTPWCIATLDRMDGDDPAELKNIGQWNAGDWAEGVPLSYWWQVQHQLAVTCAKQGILAALIGGQRFVWYEIARDDAEITRMLAAEYEFWRCVETNTPPPVDGDASTKAALEAQHPTDNGQTIPLPAEFLALDKRYCELADEHRALGKEMDEIKNRFRDAIGDATMGELPGARWKWATEAKGEYTVPAKTIRVLRRTTR